MFNPENYFWKTISRAVDFIGFGMLWIVLCLPIVTIAPATSAFYYTVVKVFFHKNEGGFGIFIKAFKSNFNKGLIISLICVPTAITIWYLDMCISSNMQSTATTILYAVFLVMAIIPLGIMCYAIALNGRFAFSVRQLFKTSAFMAMKHFPSTVLIVLELLVLSIFTLKYVWPILFTPTLAILIAAALLERIFPKYLDEAELKKFNDKDRLI